MKIAEKLKHSRLFPKPNRPGGKKGIALLTVLTVMSLTTILVLSFFSLSTSELRSSNTYSHGLQAQQVGEMAVNMAIAQIRKGTNAGYDFATGDDRSESQAFVWASQPGGIRVWDNSGDFLWLYKLYSDEQMMDPNVAGGGADFTDLANWSSSPEEFVDLNEPVIRGEKVYYPIVTPAASELPKWVKKIGDDDRGVEGFSYNVGQHRLGDSSEIGSKAVKVLEDAESISLNGHLAMPVKWIYQLADGTLGVVRDEKFEGLQGVRTKPSEDNPMVARFAFWADDETSKLNLNTAAGGLAWDIPRAGGDLDMQMGKFQPAQHEWQRYPGHPATVHLSTVLAPGVLNIVNDRDAMEMIFDIVPRVVGGGSESGTRVLDNRNPEEEDGLIADKNPLFPSLDDMVLRPDREPHEFPDSRGRPIKEEELSDYIERSKFFLTVTSRAPEVNVFNKPRVAIWPIADADYSNGSYTTNKEKLTTFDRLIHYCASMGKSNQGNYPRFEYIFKRRNADSPTEDFEEIPRNQELYNYLVRLLDTNIPGYGDKFSSKYTDRDSRQLATMIFDYIRSTNLHDDSLFDDYEEAFQIGNTDDHITYTNPRFSGNRTRTLQGHGQVVPIQIEDTRGMGRFNTLANATVQTICAGSAEKGYLYGGLNAYQRGLVEDPNYLTPGNLPPLPENVNENTPSKFPQWLSDIMAGDDAELKRIVFEEQHWNWNLAFLDSTYRNNVLSSPSQAKFKRSSLSESEFTSGATYVDNDETLVQSIFLFSLFSPSIGWTELNGDMEIAIALGDFSFTDINGGEVKFLPFSAESYSRKVHNMTQNSEGQDSWVFATNFMRSTPWRERTYGGLKSLPSLFSMDHQILNAVYRSMGLRNATRNSGRSRMSPIDLGYDKIEGILNNPPSQVKRDIQGDPQKIAGAYQYDLITLPYKVKNGAGAVNFSGGVASFEFYAGGERSEGSTPVQGINKSGIDGTEKDGRDAAYLQRIELTFPPFAEGQPRLAPATPAYENEFGAITGGALSFLDRCGLTNDSAHSVSSLKNTHGFNGEPTRNTQRAGRSGRLTYHPRDIIVQGDPANSVGVRHGDMRLIAARTLIEAGDSYFAPHPNYGAPGGGHSLTWGTGQLMAGASVQKGNYITDVNYRGKNPLPMFESLASDVQLWGDFDNGSGLMIDGPYINKPDEGNTNSLASKYDQEISNNWEAMRNFGDFPYFAREWRFESGGPAYFSPNRMVSGPGAFGSLPTGTFSDDPWQTLLFRPAEGSVSGSGQASSKDHPGGESPPDHILMDLFWMPIVEPYAISEPLSTAGKVNMNYAMVPFRHIQRNTALRGVFRSEYLLCVPNIWSGSYKHNSGRGRGYHWRDKPFGGQLQGKWLRTYIVEDDTLAEFQKRFDESEPNYFRSATEICEMYLVRDEVANRSGIASNKAKIGHRKPTVEEMRGGEYWKDYMVVGDNSRERPYTNLHQRLTTKSNTFKVHYRAQVIKQGRRLTSGSYAEWDPELDTVQAEYRGSSVIERYVDPNDDEIGDLSAEGSKSIDRFYKFRVVNPRRFAP